MFKIRKVAVLGAGVMGAQIAAHCVNAGVPVVLFDLAAKEGEPSGIARRGIAQLAKLSPAPLAAPELALDIVPANYDDDLALLGQCDLVIEAIAERADWKADLYARIAPALAAHAVLASNTSGLSLASLAQVLPAELRPRFCGVHFFNPPRYMPLVELIAVAETGSHVLDTLEAFLTAGLGKSVVRAKDTPNFIGNRVGVFGMLAAFIEAERYGLTADVVDDLTGVRLGRAKSGTFRTADVVGLDTLAHVIATMRNGLPEDPFHAAFATPPVVAALVEQGALGQKTGAGFYRKDGKTILRLDFHANFHTIPANGAYVPADQAAAPEVQTLLAERNPAKRLAGLRASDHPQAQFVWALLRDTFHYAAVHLAEIAETARDVDLAMQGGFGHAQGPFELWQSAGWAQVADWIAADIAAGRALADAALPDWVHAPTVLEAGGVHTRAGSYNPRTGQFAPRRSLAVYARQIAPPRLLGEGSSEIAGTTVLEENAAARLWTLPAPHPQDILIATLKTKMHTLGSDAVDALLQAVDLAERDFRGLVIWNGPSRFSAGADLQGIAPLAAELGVAAMVQAIDAEARKLQTLSLRLRDAHCPTVAALAGLALGGGCELALYCNHRAAHLETHIGLVEVGVGLIPGAGGLAYCARRAAEMQALHAPQAPLLAFLQNAAATIASAQVSSSARHAVTLGYLQPTDTLVMNAHELLYVAVRQAAALADAGWRAPIARPFRVAGRDGAATLTAQWVNLREGGMISDYDFELGRTVAQVLCGGDLEAGSLVDDDWMLAQERQAFLQLLANARTQERIAAMLKTGKPLRN